MRVAVLLRPDARARPGGDVVQAGAITGALRGAGHEVTEHLGWTSDLRGYDTAIVMNLTVPQQAWLQARACRRAGVPYVLVPVYWDLSSAIPSEHQPTGSAVLPTGSRRRETAQRLRTLLAAPSATTKLLAGTYAMSRDIALVRDVVQGAAGVSPNSRAELEHLAARTRLVPDARWSISWNGIRTDELAPVAAAVDRPRTDVVVSVGGVSPRKNTLGLVRAAASLDCPVLVVGPLPSPRDGYAARVREHTPANVQLLGPLPRPEVLDLLGSSAVHVQPGFVETPGLASLEAAALGTPVVVSNTAPVREYLGRHATYADPHDPASLADAIGAARRQRPSLERAEHVRDRFDWDLALRPLLRLVESAA